jgi:uncharacterized RDD family membrane protein YckC
VSYCGYCGSDVRNAAFCQNCGARQDAQPVTPYAGWGLRAAALTLDSVILALAWFVVVVIAGTVAGDSGAGAVGPPAFLLVPALFFTFGNGGRSGQTLGKKAAGIAVKDTGTGAHIGYPRALGRWLVTMLLVFTMLGTLLDHLWPAWDTRGQALHDKVVSSAVYRVTSSSQSV